LYAQAERVPNSGTIKVNDKMQYENRKREAEAEAEKLRKKRRRIERSLATGN